MSRLDWLDRGIWAPIAFGVTLIVAGMYEFTPLKRLCLRHCRAPSAFVVQYWRDGRGGALDMGMQYGLYCVGHGWALFVVLVVAGMMSITGLALRETQHRGARDPQTSKLQRFSLHFAPMPDPKMALADLVRAHYNGRV